MDTRGSAVGLEEAHGLIGNSPAMRRVVARIPAVARAKRPTLISGPTGTGKEVLAWALHRRAHDFDAPCIPVNCAALPDQLIEAELFGHTRGAFTGADHARRGLVRSAVDGTLFLDEVDALPLGAQSKLLRFLETGEYRPVGSDRTERASVWVVAATNRDLHDEVARRSFREDLLYRLDVVHLELPALRVRGGDIEILSRHFLAEVGGSQYRFTARALRALHTHPWPGNVRELKHRIERAVVLSADELIDACDLELEQALQPQARAPAGGVNELWQLIERDGMSLAQAVSYCERLLIDAALQAENDNRTRAAERLGIHVRTIFKKLSR